MNIEIVITIGVIFLALYWFFSDPRPWNERIKFIDFKRRYVGAVGVIAYILFLYTGTRFPINYGEFEMPIIFFGFFIFMVGFNLALWAKQTMGQSWNLPGRFHKEQQKNLVTSGPFRFTRNPIYMGLLLLGIGSAIVLKSPLFPLMFIFYLLVRYKIIPSEENSLRQIFREEYEKYCRMAPRLI
jgi:protein-S-isoprenylcysteine O-methyltransferase Ste14